MSSKYHYRHNCDARLLANPVPGKRKVANSFTEVRTDQTSITAAASTRAAQPIQQQEVARALQDIVLNSSIPAKDGHPLGSTFSTSSTAISRGHLANPGCGKECPQVPQAATSQMLQSAILVATKLPISIQVLFAMAPCLEPLSRAYAAQTTTEGGETNTARGARLHCKGLISQQAGRPVLPGL